MNIVGVAFQFEGEVFSLPAPKRHCHLFPVVLEKTGKRWRGDMDLDQGFIDEGGNFLNRYEALAGAKETNQLLDGMPHNPGILCSEDLW